MELEGRIGFCVSAVVEPALREALHGVKEAAWKTFDMEADGTLRQWAEVDFVPSIPYEKHHQEPLLT